MHHDLTNSILTPGEPKVVGRNTWPTIREFEEARTEHGTLPEVIIVRDIKEALTALGADPEVLGDSKEFHYLTVKNKIMDTAVEAQVEDEPELQEHEKQPLHAGQPKKVRPPKDKRHLILIKEAD